MSRQLSGGLSPVRGRGGGLNAGGRIAPVAVAVKIARTMRAIMSDMLQLVVASRQTEVCRTVKGEKGPTPCGETTLFSTHNNLIRRYGLFADDAGADLIRPRLTIIFTSTRLFCARPATVELSAIASVLPYPKGVTKRRKGIL